jgi:hypothetical protein
VPLTILIPSRASARGSQDSLASPRSGIGERPTRGARKPDSRVLQLQLRLTFDASLDPFRGPRSQLNGSSFQFAIGRTEGIRVGVEGAD